MNPILLKTLGQLVLALGPTVANHFLNRPNTKKIPLICPRCQHFYGNVDIDVYDRCCRGRTFRCDACNKDFTL